MSLEKTLNAHRVMPRWLLPVAFFGVGLFFGWEAIRPGGPGWLHRDTVQSAMRDSEGTMAEIKEYLDKTASLSQAIEGADQDELKRLLAEQKSLNQRMKKSQEERQALEENRRSEKALSERRARIWLGIAAALLVVLSVWDWLAGLGKNHGKS
jgi:hypothetical protein